MDNISIDYLTEEQKREVVALVESYKAKNAAVALTHLNNVITDFVTPTLKHFAVIVERLAADKKKRRRKQRLKSS